MSDQYLGEIRAFGFNFAPVGWAECDGQILAIQQFTALFSLLGTYFGGNGTSNFGLPNLQGATPMHWGNGVGLSPYYLGETIGSTTMTLNINQVPYHNHGLQVAEGGSGETNVPGPTAWLGVAQQGTPYSVSGTPNTPLATAAITFTGSSQPHPNQQPYQTLNFCIALTGAYPPRS